MPADNFLTTITKERYRDWLTLLRDGNQNMVRLWGGGIYEPDVFYDICDGTQCNARWPYWLTRLSCYRTRHTCLAGLPIRLWCLPCTQIIRRQREGGGRRQRQAPAPPPFDCLLLRKQRGLPASAPVGWCVFFPEKLDTTLTGPAV